MSINSNMPRYSNIRGTTVKLENASTVPIAPQTPLPHLVLLHNIKCAEEKIRIIDETLKTTSNKEDILELLRQRTGHMENIDKITKNYLIDSTGLEMTPVIQEEDEKEKELMLFTPIDSLNEVQPVSSMDEGRWYVITPTLVDESNSDGFLTKEQLEFGSHRVKLVDVGVGVTLDFINEVIKDNSDATHLIQGKSSKVIDGILHMVCDGFTLKDTPHSFTDEIFKLTKLDNGNVKEYYRLHLIDTTPIVEIKKPKFKSEIATRWMSCYG